MRVTRTHARGLVTVLVAAAGAAACQTDRPTNATQTETQAQRPAPTAATKSNLRAAAAAQGGNVASVDRRGVPQFIWGLGKQPAEPADTPATAARYHLSRYAASFGVRASDLESLEPARVRSLRQGGVLAKVRQRVNGVAVYPSEVGVLMRSNLDLVAISGNLKPTTGAHGAADFTLGYEQALGAALAEHLGVTITDSQLVELGPRGDARRFTLSAEAPANMTEGQVRRIYLADGQALQPAYLVEFYAGKKTSPDSDAFRYILSARDGRVLDRRNLTAADAYAYRVWAEPSGRPLDGPIADFTPNPTGQPDGTLPAIIPSSLVMMEGFNTNDIGQVDPWLEPNKVETNGNNVDAYSDYNAPDGYTNGDYRATTTSAEAFDRDFNVNIDPLASVDQTMASVTSLFYVNNWLHDWWYDSGFDEVAGNAQLDNYGRGGVGGDPLHAEAQDSVLAGNRNNANMSTPSDGFSPRMQMYSWTGNEHTLLHVTPSGQDYAVGTAAFGPSAFDITAELVVANDGVGAPTDGCSPIQNSVAGKIVIIDRGTCTFTVKAATAQAAGAVGVIIANNRAGAAPGLGGTDPSITIGVLSVSQTDGATLKTSVDSGVTTAHMSRFTDPDRDGSLDYTVVTHEWGHYLHHRLADCGSPQCRAQSEGWGDFTALQFMLRAGDNLDGAYAAAIYATYSDPYAGYFGIRRVPYAANPAFNALSFRHITDGEPLPATHPVNAFGDNSEVHNAGEVWASMMFEAYIALQRDAVVRGVSFDDARRRMGDYVVAGLQMTPLDATYTEARDAIIAAASAMNPADAALIAHAFALRGAGSCAESPARDSSDFAGVVEGFDLRPNIQLGNITIDDSGKSCDHDGVLDAEERGMITVQVGNASPVPLAAGTLTLTSSTAGLLFPNGTTLAIPSIEPYGLATLQLDVAIDPAYTALGVLTVGVRVDGHASCQGTVTSTIVARFNYDETNGGSTIDDVEGDRSAWTATGEGSDMYWGRVEAAPLDHAWFGLDVSGVSDTSLESPTLDVSATSQFVIDFDHRYSFEADSTFWDGGVIEISTDGGATWADLTTYANLPYGGAITDTSGNPLAQRQAFVANNPAWPMRDHVTVNLGTQLAGQHVKIRFRIGTDLSAGFYGWELDNLAFTGIDNAPFDTLVPDATVCPTPLVCSAGADQTDVTPGAIVVLDASGSVSAEGLPLTYTWMQMSGPAVTLTGASSPQAVFAAPALESGAVLTFMVTVSDGTLTADDLVDVVVLPVPAPTVVADAGPDLNVSGGQVVVLDGSRSAVVSTVPLSYTWEQTAGTAVTLADAASPVARFTAPYLATNETLSFRLTVTDGVHTSQNTVDVVVAGYALTADAGADQAVDAKALVVLDATGSRSSTNLPLTFAWRQTSGPTATIDGASRAVAKVIAPDPSADATLVFEVTVSDGARSATDTVSVSVRAAVVPSVNAVAGLDQTVDAGAVVILNGTGSYSSIGLALTYQWEQLAGPSVDLSSTTMGAVSFVAPKPGDNTKLTFKLTVSDGTRESSDTVDVNVGKFLPPTSGVTADAGDDIIANPGQLVILNASRSASDGHLALSYAWTQKSGEAVRLSDAASIVPTFTAPTSYDVQTLVFEVAVSDGTTTATDEVEVTVHKAIKPAEDDGCTCVTTPEHGQAASALSFGVLALGLFFARRKRG